MGDETKQLDWLRDRLDHIDARLAQLLTEQAANSARQADALRRIEDLEDRQDEQERTLAKAMLPAQAIKWLLAGVILLGAAVATLYGLGLRWAPGPARGAVEGTNTELGVDSTPPTYVHGAP